MIPSRPLTLVEIIGETFSIHRRLFPRYVLLFLLLVVPGAALLTYGAIGMSQHVLITAQHDHAFDDNDLTQLRNEFRAAVEKENPLLLQQLQSASADSSHAKADTVLGNSDKVSQYVSEQLNSYASDFSITAIGIILLFIGVFALATSTIEFASAIFEEREQEFGYTVRASLSRHVWKAIFLYLLYFALSLTADGFVAFIGKFSVNAADAIAGFITIAQIYIIIRMIVAIPALVSEELSPFAAIRRAMDLTRRNGWRIFGISVAFAILCFVGALFTSSIVGLVFAPAFEWFSEFLARDQITISWLVETLPGFITALAGEIGVVALLLYALLPVFGTVLYYDLRTRRDGPLAYLEEE